MSQRSASEGTNLLERERELAAVEELIERARGGRGSIVVFEGSPGVGKSELLRESRARARAAGLADLHAVGSELERSFAFGVVRQLLEPSVRKLDPATRESMLADAAGLAAPVLGIGADTESEDPFAPLHGLYWLCVNLAERQPALITLDDAHWADIASLRFLAYLAHRLEGTAICVLISLRPDQPGSEQPLFTQIQREPVAETLRLGTLSQTASVALVRSILLSDPPDEFARACHTATGGNPFYLHEIVRTLRSEGIEPTADQAGQVEQIHTESISRAVLARVMHLPESAGRLARAAAVFERCVELRHAAALADLDERAAQAAADALVSAQVLSPVTPLEFVHPVVRNSVYSEIPPSERALAHARVARMLAEDGAPPESAAAHLLVAERRGDSWAVELLCRAAAEAEQRGAPDAAAIYLRRALAEPPAEELRGQLLYDLGIARFASGELGATDEMRQGVELTGDPEQRAEMALALGRCLSLAERRPEAVEVLDSAKAALGDKNPLLAHRLEAEVIGAALINRSTLPRALEGLERAEREPYGDTLPDQLVPASLAWYRSRTGTVALTDVLPLIERARPAELIGEDTLAAFLYSVWALIFCERYSDAAALLDQAGTWAKRAGSVVSFELAVATRANVEYRRGSLRDSEAYARAAGAAPSRVEYRIPWEDVFLAEALVAHGRLEEASRVLEEADPGGEVPDLFDAYLFFHSRGTLNCARENIREGLEDFLECGRRLEQWGFRNPEVAAWRSAAALAHLRLGESDEARRLAGDEVELARGFGGPRALGIALRSCGLVEGGATGLELLEEAVSVLERSDARLALAQALCDYGAAIRRSGRRSAAREPLRRALDLAHRCGAAPLTERAHQELVAAGARPRRMASSGFEALTPSEVRVARMAAAGMTNREIAQALFVTMKTVAVHLTHTYQKLEIESREQLPEALSLGAEGADSVV